MAAIDLQTLRATIRFRGDYQNVRKFPNDAVDTEIQGAFGEFWALVDSVHEGWWDTSDTVTTIAAQEHIALPADAWRVKGVDLLDGGEYRQLDQIGISERNRFGSTSDEPEAYRLSARGIELYPTPNAAYTLRVHYSPKAPALQEAQPREWFNGWEDYVIEATLIRLDRSTKLPLTDRQTALAMIEKRIKSEATERRSQEPEYVPLRECGDFLTPVEKGVFR